MNFGGKMIAALMMLVLWVFSVGATSASFEVHVVRTTGPSKYSAGAFEGNAHFYFASGDSNNDTTSSSPPLPPPLTPAVRETLRTLFFPLFTNSLSSFAPTYINITHVNSRLTLFPLKEAPPKVSISTDADYYDEGATTKNPVYCLDYVKGVETAVANNGDKSVLHVFFVDSSLPQNRLCTSSQVLGVCLGHLNSIVLFGSRELLEDASTTLLNFVALHEILHCIGGYGHTPGGLMSGQLQHVATDVDPSSGKLRPESVGHRVSAAVTHSPGLERLFGAHFSVDRLNEWWYAEDEHVGKNVVGRVFVELVAPTARLLRTMKVPRNVQEYARLFTSAEVRRRVDPRVPSQRVFLLSENMRPVSKHEIWDAAATPAQNEAKMTQVLCFGVYVCLAPRAVGIRSFLTIITSPPNRGKIVFNFLNNTEAGDLLDSAGVVGFTGSAADVVFFVHAAASFAAKDASVRTCYFSKTSAQSSTSSKTRVWKIEVASRKICNKGAALSTFRQSPTQATSHVLEVYNNSLIDDGARKNPHLRLAFSVYSYAIKNLKAWSPNYKEDATSTTVSLFIGRIIAPAEFVQNASWFVPAEEGTTTTISMEGIVSGLFVVDTRQDLVVLENIPLARLGTTFELDASKAFVAMENGGVFCSGFKAYQLPVACIYDGRRTPDFDLCTLLGHSPLVPAISQRRCVTKDTWCAD